MYVLSFFFFFVCIQDLCSRWVGCLRQIKESLTMFFVHDIAKKLPLLDISQGGLPRAKSPKHPPLALKKVAEN